MMASWSSRYSLFWNIALTFKLRQVPPRYSGLQSLLSCPHGVVIHARWERMAWRNWYDQRWEGWNGGKGMHSNFEKSPFPLQWFPVLVFLSTRKIVIRARWERMAWRNWYDERWEGWNGGKGMHGVKHSWSGTAIVPRDNESNSHNHRIHVATVQRNFCYSQCKHKDILWMNYFQCTEKVDGYPLDCKFTFKRLDTFVTLTSGIWELSIKFFCHSRWHVSKWVLCTEKTIAIRSMYRGIFHYRDVPVF